MSRKLSNFASRLSRSRAGFTLFELVLGMMIPALVTAPSAALLSAVAQGWKASDSSSDNSLTIMQTHQRLQRVLRAAKQIGACRTGAIEGSSSGCVLLWKADTN